MRRNLQDTRVSEEFFVEAGAPRLDSLVVIPDPWARSVALGRAETGVRVVTSVPESVDEQRITVVGRELEHVYGQLQVALNTTAQEVDVLLSPSVGLLGDLLDAELPAQRAVVGVLLDIEAVVVRFGTASASSDPKVQGLLKVADSWVTSLARTRAAQIAATSRVQEAAAAGRARRSAEYAVATADAKRLKQALKRTQTKLTNVEVENKRLARRYQSLADSRLGKFTLLYWRLAAKLRKKRTIQ